MFYYRPTLEYAYTDIVGLREHVPLGIMREMHRWGAHAMVITVWLHMFRVFMTGSYKPPREFNWSVGVILLVLTLLLSFTGYLLPWDQLAIWAITVGSNMARATPFLGHEGPGAAAAAAGRRPADPRGRRRAVRAARRHVRRRRRAAALLRAALRRPAARHRGADGGALLARPQGRRHLRTAVERRSAQARSLKQPPSLRTQDYSNRTMDFIKGIFNAVADPRLFFLLAVLRCSSCWSGSASRSRRTRSATALLGFLTLFFVFGIVRPELPADRDQAGQRADRRPDLPAGLLRLVLDARRRAERSPDRRRAGTDREGGIRSRLGLARPGLHRADLADRLLGRPDRLVDLPEGAARAAGQPANTPNPSKAPWYFLGLQEMLVYFDPWLAGVVLPEPDHRGADLHSLHRHEPEGQRLLHVQRAQGRDHASSCSASSILWSSLIVLGTFLRGPNWNFFGPYEFWDIHKLEALTNVNLSEYIWVRVLRHRAAGELVRPRDLRHPARAVLRVRAAGVLAKVVSRGTTRSWARRATT